MKALQSALMAGLPYFVTSFLLMGIGLTILVLMLKRKI